MSIQTIILNSWEEYRTRIVFDQFDDGLFRRGRFLFRGQGGATWKLVSSFDRGYSGDRASKMAVADRLVETFKRECEQHELPFGFSGDPMAWLALAQHSGLPTRLLDWSESPYVAAFFAFSSRIRSPNVDPAEKVAVWVIDTTSAIWNSGYGCDVLTVPSFGNIRIANQQGRFTYLKSPYDNLEDHINVFAIEDAPTLRKYEMPVSEAHKAIADLDAMGLTYSRIYPGLEGNARAAEIRVGLEAM